MSSSFCVKCGSQWVALATLRICSYAARDALVGGSTPLLTSASERQVRAFQCFFRAEGVLLFVRTFLQAYLCHCCLAPCAKCSGSYKTAKLNSGSVQATSLQFCRAAESPRPGSQCKSRQDTISGKMSEITGLGGDLFNPSGSNSLTAHFGALAATLNVFCSLHDLAQSSNASSSKSAITLRFIGGDFFTEIWSQATRRISTAVLQVPCVARSQVLQLGLSTELRHEPWTQDFPALLVTSPNRYSRKVLWCVISSEMDV